jgi:hypothetical protein
VASQFQDHLLLSNATFFSFAQPMQFQKQRHAHFRILISSRFTNRKEDREQKLSLSFLRFGLGIECGLLLKKLAQVMALVRYRNLGRQLFIRIRIYDLDCLVWTRPCSRDYCFAVDASLHDIEHSEWLPTETTNVEIKD